MAEMTKSQIDRLGERLKAGPPEESDLRLLDEFRGSFAEAYAHVVGVLRDDLGLQVTGRRAKTTASIITKIQREKARLSQVQDIAGCRVVVADLHAQNRVVASLQQAFPDARLIDRRARPSHGYRAVHVIVRSDDKLVEVQVRTTLQHLWAELSEKLADAVDPAIKYGGGPATARADLDDMGLLVADVENLEGETGHDEVYQRLVRLLRRMIAGYEKRGP